MEGKQMPSNIELKSAQGPIIIERFQPQCKFESQLGQTSYSLAESCTSLNLQFISMQKMDSVLHSIQRRLYKQKEQVVFAEYIKSNVTSTEARTRLVQIDTGHICFERGSTEKFTNSAYTCAKVHGDSDVKIHSKTNENLPVRELVKELKKCITALTTSVNHDNAIQFNKDTKPSFRQRKDKKIAAFSRNCLVLQNRGENTKSFEGTLTNKPQQLKKVEHNPKVKHNAIKPALKTITFANKFRRTEADLKKTTKSVMLPSELTQCQPSHLVKYCQNSEKSPGKARDALALWKMLSEMEKVEELVCRNLQMIHTDVKERVPDMYRKAYSAITGNNHTNTISRRNADTTCSASVIEDKSSDHGQILEGIDVPTMPRGHDLRFGHHNSSFATKFLSPNSDIVATIKELSNTVVDDMLIEVSNEILDLPEAFLTELLESEFATNNLQR